MSSSSAQKDYGALNFKVVCSMLNELDNKLEKGKKAGSATLAGTNGEKDSIDVQKLNEIQESLMNITVESHGVGYDKDTKMAIRNVNGKNQLIDKSYMRKIYESAKRSGKSMITVKAPEIKDEKENDRD